MPNIADWIVLSCKSPPPLCGCRVNSVGGWREIHAREIHLRLNSVPRRGPFGRSGIMENPLGLKCDSTTKDALSKMDMSKMDAAEVGTAQEPTARHIMIDPRN